MANSKYNKCILVTDLDGTLLKPLSYDQNDYIVPEANRAFLSRFLLGSGKVVLWSGHSLSVCEKIIAQQAEYMGVDAKALPINIVARNGSLAKVNKSIIHDVKIAPSIVSKIEALVRRKDAEWKKNGIDEVSSFSIGGIRTPFVVHKHAGDDDTIIAAEDVIAKIFGNTACRYDKNAATNENAYINLADDNEFEFASKHANEIVVFSKNNDKFADIIKTILAEFDEHVEMANSFELISKGQNKVNTLVELIKVMDPIAKSELIIIGDGKRDIPAITFARDELKARSKLKLGFAIKAIDKLGNVSNQEVIDSVEADHVVEFVADIEKLINKSIM